MAPPPDLEALHALIEGRQALLCSSEGPDPDSVIRARDSIANAIARTGHP
jgi:hypothetical protein